MPILTQKKQKMKQCPLLKKCKKASGIDCKDRDYKNCNLFLRLKAEKEKEIKEKEKFKISTKKYT